MGSLPGGRGDASPAVKKIRSVRPLRFESKMAQIRCLIRFLGILEVDWAPADDSSLTHKSVATPLGTDQWAR